MQSPYSADPDCKDTIPPQTEKSQILGRYDVKNAKLYPEMERERHRALRRSLLDVSGCRLYLRTSASGRRIAVTRVTPGMSTHRATSTTTTRPTRMSSSRLLCKGCSCWHIVPSDPKTNARSRDPGRKWQNNTRTMRRT